LKVLLLSRYTRQGASSRVRSYQFLPYLGAHGVQVTASPLLDEGYLDRLYTGRPRDYTAVARAMASRASLLRRAAEFDLLWIEKELFPWLPQWGESLLARSGIPYVVDFDDAVFHYYDEHRTGFVRRVLGRKIDAVMRGAAVVVAGNEYIAGRARSAGARTVEILPTVVDLDRYRVQPRIPGAPFTVGWMGTPVTAALLDGVAGVLAEAAREGDRVVLVGAGAAPPSVRAEVRPWSEAAEVRDIRDFDVGIMPLPDTPVARGKCGYKLIQYMAAGRPVIASPIGANRAIVQDGVSGFLARDAGEWRRALRLLRADPELAVRMGRAGRERVEREYSLAVVAPRLLGILRQAARGGAACAPSSPAAE
jgi:glycosyltransferase involved in cell wall biosynthesis